MSKGPPGPAFITGGSSGIGLALARRLHQRGHRLALFARDPDRLAQAAEGLDPPPLTLPCDVTDRSALESAVAQARAELGPPRYAIASAGVAVPGVFLDQPLADHETQMQVNYMGALYFARATAVLMQPGARLIFIGSGAAFFGIPGYSAYAPSKFALRGLAEVLRVELAPRGIAVTLAYPPDTDTPQLAAEARTKPPATREITAGGGLWQPDDVARVILHAADKGRFAAAPGLQMRALLWLHSLAAPVLRAWQTRIMRRHDHP
ncbi:MAG: SDR family oxidoreductase [Pseudomonadota bacterium]